MGRFIHYLIHNKVLRYIVLGLGVYAIVALLVMKYYKDDPGAMIWQDREAYNKRYIAKLSPQQHIVLADVFQTLGTPDLTFVRKLNGDTYQIVYYRTQHVKSDGITTRDECTGLLFKNGKLVAWGPSAQQSYDLDIR